MAVREAAIHLRASARQEEEHLAPEDACAMGGRVKPGHDG
jgi:hypothetical protein